MIWDASLQFFHKKTTEQTARYSEVEQWIASGEFERYFAAWRRDMYRSMVHLAGIDADPDLSLAAILHDPPLFGFNYALYKAMTNEDDFTLPNLNQLKLDL